LGASLAELLAADAAATVEAALRERLARERELGPEYTVEGAAEAAAARATR
jgi:hypothetical protein